MGHFLPSSRLKLRNHTEVELNCSKPYSSNHFIRYCCPFFRSWLNHFFCDCFRMIFQKIQFNNKVTSYDLFHQIWLVVRKHVCKTFRDVFKKVKNLKLLFGHLGRNYLPRYWKIFSKLHWKFFLAWKIFSEWKIERNHKISKTQIIKNIERKWSLRTLPRRHRT